MVLHELAIESTSRKKFQKNFQKILENENYKLWLIKLIKSIQLEVSSD